MTDMLSGRTSVESQPFSLDQIHSRLRNEATISEDATMASSGVTQAQQFFQSKNLDFDQSMEQIRSKVKQ